jgi:hypothetical protein
MAGEAPLEARLPAPGAATADDLLDLVLSWVSQKGLSLYPAQEQAVLELFAGNNVILGTPTGSGKSLVATAACFWAMAWGLRAYYTVPIKALASEKFFALSEELGAGNVGLATGDASVNPGAPVICCTAEVLMNLALRQGKRADVGVVVMDEFHYYADRDRGVAWQVPLLVLEDAQFLLMSATLGDTTPFEQRLERLTDRRTVTVAGGERPVPLDYRYAETPLHETVADLVRSGKAPIYLVSFTQRAAAERAQDLTSVDVCTKEEKKAILAELEGVRFGSSPYGKEVARFVKHGIGVHHAGLLPKYRRLVERLAQKGLLKIVSGTDTLGVGINVPIRTVLLTQLCKYDGEKTALLSARDFHQIAGRAGRKGYDVQGSVVVQAPEHVVENLRVEQKAGGDKAKLRKIVRKKPPEHGYVHWDKAIFERLVAARPEPLQSRFRMSHGMLLQVLAGPDGSCRQMGRILHRSHEPRARKRQHARTALQMFESLEKTGIIAVEDGRPRVHADLQEDFSLHHALSLWLVEAVGLLDRQSPTYAMDVLTLVEAVLEDPELVLRAQVDKLKQKKLAELKAAGVEYEERMAELDKIEHPMPLRELIEGAFTSYAQRHPWVGSEIRPKCVARELVEGLSSFSTYVKEYGLSRSEGLLLRYLSDAYKTLVQTVPEPDKTPEVLDAEQFLRTIVRQADSTLLDEWEAMRAGHPQTMAKEGDEAAHLDVTSDEKAFAVLVRNEAFSLVRALAGRDWAAAADVAGEGWPPRRLEQALAPYFEEHGEIRIDADARGTRCFALEKMQDAWIVRQTLLEPAGEGEWTFDAKVDLARSREEGRAVLALERLGP